MADPASQLRIQDTKEKLQTAYNHAVNAKESAESDFKQQQDIGLTDGQDFRAPAYAAALNNYQATKAAYDAALRNGDNEAFTAWEKKYKDVVLENPAKPNYDALVEP
ncbi:hypothetical protein FGADI_6746 [Fusarium gaditjirri]|uniref:Uncharacterized protein n=1 Tax=Fusarium gaditjirri TaxID=282569 RepID=A0A8H4T706_9HYPO|nr:hypothetical protein FGADI_6746 [Fusarium gaditjirri]